MSVLIDNRKALQTLKDYFSVLERVGYVKETTVRRYILYLFLLEFVDSVSEFITDDDRVVIDRLMKKLFTNGGCLLSYPAECADKVEMVSNNKRVEEEG